MQMPSIDTFNSVIDKLLQTLKYIKFNKWVLNQIYNFLKWLWELIKYLFMRSSTGKAGIGGTKIVLVSIVAFVVVVTLLLIVWMIIRSKRKRKVKSILGEKIDKNSTVGSFIDRSKELEDKGAYREAIRLRFIAVLFYLHENHYLYHDNTMTGQEMINRLKADRFIAVNAFSVITGLFNYIWYGMKEIDKTKYEDWRDNENIFWQEVRK